MQARLRELVPRILRGKPLERTSARDVREEAEDRLGLARGGLDRHRDSLNRIISDWVEEHVTDRKDEASCTRKRRRADLAESSLAGWRDLWESRRFPDAEVHCGGITFDVHRAVLGARSPVLDAMFRQEGLREGSERRVIIEDAPPEVVEALLRYMYVGEVAENSEHASLLRLADKYEVEGLTEICVEALLQCISTETVVSSLCALRTHRARGHVAAAYERLLASIQSDRELLRAVADAVCESNPSWNDEP